MNDKSQYCTIPDKAVTWAEFKQWVDVELEKLGQDDSIEIAHIELYPVHHDDLGDWYRAEITETGKLMIG